MEHDMMPPSHRDGESGSIGIGAMIVFIALILVAAVASTIIIKTAEELQQNAEATSDDTRKQISGKVTILDVLIRSTGDELGTGDDTDINEMDVIFRVASGSIGVQQGDVDYYITCRIVGTAVDNIAIDAGDFDAIELDAIAALADGTDLDAGNVYYATITLGDADTDESDVIDVDDTDPGCNTGAGAGESLQLRVVVDGGGETLMELQIDSITLGSSIM